MYNYFDVFPNFHYFNILILLQNKIPSYSIQYLRIIKYKYLNYFKAEII
ncbi:hypothetical protein Cop2CBH44_19510 [Coprobacter secundus subsp. similis]|uniref:Uncharacterized protein n=1 Tax=Coprobacter secundus subsp. similis TaxID=2751153 RepID=A0A7G1HZG7_9BACT|nr:hypothetical protein Cop2CBH44_19510 [Coprobacter secundus subsp. similis]